MLLRDIAAEPVLARRYMERYVNNGSPSGFTHKYTSSSATSPFGSSPSFSLFVGSLSTGLIESFGVLPEWLEPGTILLHPDMATQVVITSNCAVAIDNRLRV